MDNKTTSRPLSCNVKSVQYLSIGDSPFHSGCGVIEAQFPNMRTEDIGKISFVNNYTASLTVKFKVACKTKLGQPSNKWVTGVKNYPLMPNPHCETGSQSYFSILPCDYCHPPNEVSTLRFILKQPSPNWKSFTIEEVYIYPRLDEDSNVPRLPKWLEDTEDPLLHGSDSSSTPSDLARTRGLPDPEEVSRKMQELLLLAGKAEEVAPTVELGRFDVDGSYEINLLSYT